MKKDTVMKKLSLPEKKNMRLLLATFLLTLGVYFSFPERGILATFPLLFLFSFAAGLVYSPLFFFPLASGAIALFYGVMANFSDPFLFALVSAVAALCGAVCAGSLLNLKSRKKWIGAVLFFFCLLLGMILPLVFAGTPSAYLKERQRAQDYLESRYPEQTFSDLVFYYDVHEKDYCALVSYLYEENTLTSTLRFGKRVQDGFFADYARFVLTKRKADLIELFQEKEFNLIAEEVELLLEKEDTVPGTYGTVSEKMYPFTHFSLTFREEKPDREEFADSCRSVLLALREENLNFGKITFYGLDAGNVLYRCEVENDTKIEDVLALVKYNR